MLLNVLQRRASIRRVRRDGIGVGLLLDADDDSRSDLCSRHRRASRVAANSTAATCLQQDAAARCVDDNDSVAPGPQAAWSGRRCGSGIRVRADRQSRRRYWCQSAMTACSISVGRQCRAACMVAMFGVTRYWRTSPPIGMTCATPGSAEAVDGSRSRRSRELPSATRHHRW